MDLDELELGTRSAERLRACVVGAGAGSLARILVRGDLRPDKPRPTRPGPARPDPRLEHSNRETSSLDGDWTPTLRGLKESPR